MKTVSPSILMVVLGLTLAVGSMAAPTGAQAADDKGLFEQYRAALHRWSRHLCRS